MSATALFGAIGFFDDYLKITRRSSGGLTPRQKMGLQVVVALAVGLSLMWLASTNQYNTRLIFPFFKDLIPDLGWWYVPFAAFFLAALVVASILTLLFGALPGVRAVLAVVVAVRVALGATVAAYRAGQVDFLTLVEETD